MKKILFFLFLLVSGIIISRFVISIYTLWHKQDVLTIARHQLLVEKKENQALRHQLLIVNSPGFLEEEVRNKLFMSKPGEGEIMMDTNLLTPKEREKNNQDIRPYWQQWLALFF